MWSRDPSCKKPITTKKWPPAVILKSSVACASRAVLGFRIPHIFNLLKLDNVAKIFEVCSQTAEVWVSVLVSNGYPSSFVQKITKARTTPRREPVAEFKSSAVYLMSKEFQSLSAAA